MIYKATCRDAEAVAELAKKLWPDNTVEDLIDDFARIIESDNAAVYIARLDCKDVGFAQCQLRFDYVEGTKSSPVGYLEGIYVDETYRRNGVARRLLGECEKWAVMKGCREFASDCEIENLDSLNFHLKMGFIEQNRVICFAKMLTK